MYLRAPVPGRIHDAANPLSPGFMRAASIVPLPTDVCRSDSGGSEVLHDRLAGAIVTDVR